MISSENPWKDLEKNSIRRIDSDLIHDLFWVLSEKGNFGLKITECGS